MLVDNLPPDAAVWRQDGPFVTDSVPALLALLVEELNRWQLAQLVALSNKSPRDLEQKGYKRLELRKQDALALTTDRAKIAAFFGRRHGPAPKRPAGKRGAQLGPTKAGQRKTSSEPQGR